MGVGYKDLLNAKDTGNSRSMRDILKKYLFHFPLFLASLAMCFGIAFLYIRNTIPKYKASTLIWVKNDNRNTNNSKASNDILDNAMNGLGTVNLENELLRLRSTELIKKVVERGGYNLSYYIVGKIRKSDIYHDAPFRLELKSINDSSFTGLTITNMDSKGAIVYKDAVNNSDGIQVEWNKEFSVKGKTFSLAPNHSSFNKEARYAAEWKPVNEEVKNILHQLSVGTSGTNTTIIEISLLIENLQRGKDILNHIADEFKKSNIEELKILTNNTIEFIDRRLREVTGELKGVEGNLENYKGTRDAIDIEKQSTQSFANENEVSKAIANTEIQQQVLDMVGQSLKSSNQSKPIPSMLAISDPNLTDLVSKYNSLQLRKQRESPDLGPKSVALKDMNDQINSIKSSIEDALQSLSTNLRQQASSLRKQKTQYTNKIASLPGKEIGLQDIQRQREVKEGLFLYLLQKKEEAGISEKSQPSNYDQIDPASGYGPVEPNKSTIYKLALLAGLFFPFVFIYFRDLLNDKITTREDIMKKTAIPIAGELSHISKFNSQVLPALQPGLTGEQFRIIRSHLALLQKDKEQKVILVTSTISGEGKSFISLNLAAILAKSEKKIALLEFDFRKPNNQSFGVDQSCGLTDYLTGSIDIHDIVQPLQQLPNLHIYPAGSLVDDPGDLLLNVKIPRLFDGLRKKYDLILINSAPAGLVSDPVILGQYADTVLYVIKQKYTSKSQVGFIDDLFRTGKFKNMCIVFNDVRTGVKLGYYGYGYVKGSPYYAKWRKAKKKNYLPQAEIQNATDL